MLFLKRAYLFVAAGDIGGIFHSLPGTVVVDHDPAAHAVGSADDFVVLAGIGGVAEKHREITVADVHRAMNPERGHVADGASFDLDDTDLRVGRFHEHQPATAQTEVHLWPVRHGMHVPAGHEELVADATRGHARRAGDQVSCSVARPVIGDLVDDIVTPLCGEYLEGVGVGVQAGEIAQSLAVARASVTQQAGDGVNRKGSGI